MSPFAVLFAAEWQDKLKEMHEKVQEYNDQVPDYVAKVGVPTLEKMPEMNIAADFVLILTVIAILIALWRLLTLRIFRFLFAVIAVLLMAYYPAAYGFHWWLFKYDGEAKAARDEMPAYEKKMHDNLKFIDYGIMAGGVVLGGTLLLITRKKRDEGEEQSYEQEAGEAPWHQEQRQSQQQQQRQRSRGKPEKDPFDFS
jgi:hypothetical protein